MEFIHHMQVYISLSVWSWGIELHGCLPFWSLQDKFSRLPTYPLTFPAESIHPIDSTDVKDKQAVLNVGQDLWKMGESKIILILAVSIRRTFCFSAVFDRSICETGHGRIWIAFCELQAQRIFLPPSIWGGQNYTVTNQCSENNWRLDTTL